MIYWILFVGIALAGIYIGIKTVHTTVNPNWLEYVGLSIVGAFVGALVGFVVVVVLTAFVSSVLPSEEYIDSTEKLVPIVVEGGKPYYLGAGNNDDNAKYAYAINDISGRVISVWDADVVEIVPIEGEEPRVEVVRHHFKNDILQFLLPPFQDPYHKVYIPEDSIKTAFNIETNTVD
jgi:hypothetical protein